MRDGKIPDGPRAAGSECMGARSFQAGDHEMREIGQENLKVREDQTTQVEHGLDLQSPQVSSGQVPNRKVKERHIAKPCIDVKS